MAGGASLREMASKYEVNFRTIHRWVKGLEKGVVPAGEVNVARRGIEIAEREPMPTEVRELQRELREARLYNKLLNAMIDIAEEEMGVEIRKKRGARQ